MNESLIELMHTFMDLNGGATYRELVEFLPLPKQEVARYLLKVTSISYTGWDSIICGDTVHCVDSGSYHIVYKVQRQRNARYDHSRESSSLTS